ncbi:MAG: hypothetical protein JXB34_09830 [Bacteroidales bacterium]|nr:hypothetical protein [Bacteroidales bacterium]
MAGKGYFDFQMVFDGDMVNSGIITDNRVTGSRCMVKFRESGNYHRLLMDDNSAITFDFIDNRLDTLLSVTSSRNSAFVGIAGDTVYKMLYIEKYNCYELFCNDSIIALVNELNDRKVILLSSSVSKGQLGDMLNLFFAVEYSYAVWEKLNSMFYIGTD